MEFETANILIVLNKDRLTATLPLAQHLGGFGEVFRAAADPKRIRFGLLMSNDAGMNISKFVA
jgi:hypothetical protein